MADKKEIYADGIGQIHFAGAMVRFDFVTLQPKGEGEAPVPESTVRIIMPPQATPISNKRVNAPIAEFACNVVQTL